MANKKKKNSKKQIGEKSLKLQDMQNFTVGEIVEKSKRVEQENKTNENVLDKYIRQHRDEIEKVKSENLDTFIQDERQKLEKKTDKTDTKNLTELSKKVESEKEVLTEETVSDSSVKTSEDVKTDKPAFDEVKISNPNVVPVILSADAMNLEDADKEKSVNDEEVASSEVSDKNEKAPEVEATSSDETVKNTENIENDEKVTDSSVKKPIFDKVKIADPTDTLAALTIDKVLPERSSKNTAATQKEADKQQTEQVIDNQTKSHKTPIIIGACAVVLLLALATGFALNNKNAHKPETAKTTVTSKSASKQKSEKFNKNYAAFFTNSQHTALKNSNFTKISTLEKEATTTQEKKDYTALKTQIAAIQTVNGLFEKDAIVNGKFANTVKLKNKVTIPATPKTSNKALNTLLAEAIALANKQQATLASSTKTSTSQSSQSQKSANTQSSASASSASSTTTKTENTTGTSSAASTTTQAVTVDSSNARIQPQANLDLGNPAFTWNAGIEQMVLDKCRARGYITGNDYILVPTAIHTTNGTQGFPAGIVSGYYNLYRSDGTYLVSINDKTGYFVGNGAGHASGLDY
ncbi:cell division site-positioning protein MapZ family protein [Lactococcus nasutitermitis]|uniref:Cell division site-positioning protein MapZ family protein n=1 Tax=Lactococcus nasutitermitis TaxID=1652957 RepID=A0ABV9JFR0_9LACT|nr:cell division site-positioning protein MapZ family protein [Lactococcus nasutitermitis]